MRSLLISLTLISIPIQEYVPPVCFAYHKIQAEHIPDESKCLSVMIYGEARGESDRGQVAVAYTAVNRAAKKTVCNVVLTPKQYSVFNGNDALKAAAMSATLEPMQKNSIDKQSWEKATKIARMVLNREIKDPTNGSAYYISPSAMKSFGYTYPKWTLTYKKTVHIGNHVFFKDMGKNN